MINKRFSAAALSGIGVSFIGQVLGFGRQLLVAAFFGVSRGLDTYFIAYAIAMMVVFTFGSIFDSVAVPRLVQLRERDGEDAERALAVAIFRLSWLIGIAASGGMLLATWVLKPIVAAGFDAAERAHLSRLIWYFLPWAVLFVPYYAAAARHKARRSFNRVFSAEIGIGLISIGCLAIWHSSVEFLPLAYAAGYAGGLVALLPRSGLLRNTRNPRNLRRVLRNLGELFVANQTGNAPTLVDRHFQSLVPVGGIAAVNYAAQLVNGLGALLLFREIFVVPLSEAERRGEKLQRLIAGILLLALPAAAFTACFAPEIVRLLFQRGRFDATAAALTAQVLTIYVFTLIPAVITTPLARMFQIIDRIGFMHIVYLSSTVFLAGFGYLFVATLGLGAPGVAWMALCNSILSVGVVAILLARAGVVLDWRSMSGYLAFAAGVTAVAALAGLAVASLFGVPLIRLVAGGGAFASVVASAYYVARVRLRRIIYS